MYFRRLYETTIFGDQIHFISENQHMDVVTEQDIKKGQGFVYYF